MKKRLVVGSVYRDVLHNYLLTLHIPYKDMKLSITDCSIKNMERPAKICFEKMLNKCYIRRDSYDVFKTAKVMLTEEEVESMIEAYKGMKDSPVLFV